MNDVRNHETGWRVLVRRHPSAFLLAAQLLSLVIFPLLDDSTGGRVVFSAFGAMVLLLAVWVVNRTPAVNWIAWLIAIPAFVLSILSVASDSVPLLLWSSALEALLYFYVAASLIAYMLSDHRVTTDELFAAGATFTLLAWGFAYLYLICQAWYPDSFTGAVMPERPRTWLELLFFSFTNLSATGLGDILPLGSAARVLTMLEQLAGIGYIAVVVSRLIGLSLLRAGSR
ncbi:glucan phosphoethanolaminetransferase (alkaline phosphatase superfamily) [Lysobacter niabensis]|uniref:Glucan phosphoethanolaminetransferase (Alkaline phosphatase superfamily) n=1 Tax=Agrilutibacter niabensis TaxID=380628 RepID=A0ABU1VT89_9GAMM|nr:potassium channel family protein [Lysobacter niabensis]MDR7100711.1 glucan phosphoethanolaminetransferase (alkaline phosphatase superfamily) [Lysobacter niabensis]